jgi:hypothetical protein
MAHSFCVGIFIYLDGADNTQTFVNPFLFYSK